MIGPTINGPPEPIAVPLPKEFELLFLPEGLLLAAGEAPNTKGPVLPVGPRELLFALERGIALATETTEAPEPAPEGEEGYPPFIEKFAHVMMVLFA